MKEITLIGFLISLPVISRAQSSTISQGDTIRVTYSDIVTSRITGKFHHSSDDSLYLIQKDSTISIPLTSVEKIDVSSGRRTWGGRGAAIGAVTGGLLLGVISMVSTGDSDSNSDPWGFGGIELFSPGESFLLGFGLGAAGGAFVGFIIGRLTETHRWEKFPLEVGVEPISFNLAKSPYNCGLSVRLIF